MENGRTFIIDGKRRFWAEWLFTLAAFVWLSVCTFRGTEGGFFALFVLAVIHIFAVKNMTSRIMLDAHGVSFKSLLERKRYAWNEISDCGIVCKKRLGRHGRYVVHTVYFSDMDHSGEQAAKRLPYRGIRMRIRPQDVEPIACELRTFARLYASVEPQIAEEC